MTKILKCDCEHKFQDGLYGQGMRVHNLSEDKKSAFCTVCSPSNRRNKTVSRPNRRAKRVA